MRVCAVQLNLKHCADYASFVSYLQKEVFDNLLIVPDLLVFPENINLCLLFAKKDKSFENFDLDVLYSDSNLGFSGGQNLGIKESLKRNADYIVVLNMDTQN